MNARAFIGKPYRDRAAGPDAFDCWGLMRAASAALYDTPLPTLARTVSGRRRWCELSEPVPGCAVALLDMRGHPYHVGLYVGAGLVLHTTAQLGARIESLRVMTRNAAGRGFYTWPA
jgi:cell wall-associated NlpC family hydrolase